MLTGVTTEQKGEQRWSGLRFARDGGRKENMNGWIPVEDRLPEENTGTVWGTVKNRCGKYITVRLNWAYGKFTFMSGLPVENDDCMIAWKPYYVPDPYRPEREKEC